MTSRKTIAETSEIAQFKTYKKEAMTAADELCYGYDVVAKLKKAKTSDEISRIMLNARKEKFG